MSDWVNTWVSDGERFQDGFFACCNLRENVLGDLLPRLKDWSVTRVTIAFEDASAPFLDPYTVESIEECRAYWERREYGGPFIRVGGYDFVEETNDAIT